MKALTLSLAVLMALNAGAQMPDSIIVKTPNAISVRSPYIDSFTIIDPSISAWNIRIDRGRPITFCPHIYVAVMDTVVTTGSSTIFLYNPQDLAKQIVCILCHRITKQTVMRIEGASITMPIGGTIKLDTLHRNWYQQYNKTTNP